MLYGCSYLQQSISGEVNFLFLKHKFLFSVFVIFFILVFISLGSWQIIRLNWKNNLILEIENSLKNSPVELAQSNKENYWFSLNREDILKFTGKEFSKYIIYLNGNYQVPKPKKITANISNNHQKYALTWFSLAISILLLYLYFRKKNY